MYQAGRLDKTIAFTHDSQFICLSSLLNQSNNFLTHFVVNNYVPVKGMNESVSQPNDVSSAVNGSETR
jgi:hypothetical protein